MVSGTLKQLTAGLKSLKLAAKLALLNVRIIALLFTLTVHKYIYPPVSKVHSGSFRVSVIHRILTWTAGSFMCVCDHSYACVYTQGFGTLTVSQLNIFDLKKLTNLLVPLTVFEPQIIES